MRRPPLRSCVACHTGREQRQLLRVVRTPSGEVVADPSGRANGRGAYVCRDPDCITIATGRGGLSRALAAPVPPGVATDLAAQLAATNPEPTHVGGSLGQE